VKRGWDHDGKGLGKRAGTSLGKLRRGPTESLPHVWLHGGPRGAVARAVRRMRQSLRAALDDDSVSAPRTVTRSSGSAESQPSAPSIELVGGEAPPSPLAGAREINSERRVEHTKLIGYPGREQRRLSAKSKHLALSILDPEVRSYSRAIAPRAVRLKGYPIFGGVFDADGESVPGSRVVRGGGGGCLIAGARPGCVAYVEMKEKEEVLYGGIAFDHFGHFLLETLSRVWHERLTQGRAPIYVQLVTPELPRFAARMYELAGLRERIRLVERSTRCKRVIVPEPAFIIRNRAHVSFKALCTSMAERVMRGSRVTISEQPLYLSRSRLAGGARGRRLVLGEPALEEVLVRNGVRVVHPQELDLAEQIRLVNSHRTIIGPIGSAFHLLLFSMICNQTVGITYGLPNLSYLLCDALNGTRATYVRASLVPPIVTTKELPLGRLPVLLEVGKVLSAFKGLGLISDDRLDAAPTVADAHEYKRAFLQRALVEARALRIAAVVAQAETIVSDEFANDAELNRLLKQARTACSRAPGRHLPS
jgi:hypothetical protein